VTGRSVRGIAVLCDHTDDAQVDAPFARIRRDQGRLDLLVNNAWSGYEISPDPALAFREIEWRHWDLMFTGGLRADVLVRSGQVLTTPERARELRLHRRGRPRAIRVLGRALGPRETGSDPFRRVPGDQ